MIVYRIGRTKYANDLTGEGARLNGGRWNHKLTPCVYTSESRALAVLEYTVNVNIDDIPRALSISAIDIPEKNILALTIKGQFSIIKVPSAVLPNEYNFLLNPLHTDRSKFSIVDVQDFVFDVRIKNN